MFKTKTHNAYIIIMINKESYIKKKSHKDSIRIVITHEDCGNIEIQNNLWYNAINSTNLNLMVNFHSTIGLLLLTKPMVGVFHAK